MNSPRKSTASSKSPDHEWGEDLARLHCLRALFKDWTEEDPFLLRQLKASIEESIRENPDLSDSYETFSSLANRLREESPMPSGASHAFIRIDFSGTSWDPLFARHEIVRQLKREAGKDHIFLLVKGLRKALFPAARYRTRARDEAYNEATRLIDELARRWSTESSRIHLLYV